MKRDPKWTGFYVEHEPVHSDTSGPSRTRQEFAEECDINSIMARYETTGIISHVDPRPPVYMDFTNVPDLQGTLRILDEAQDAFMSLPARVRLEFENDVHKFVAFAEDQANLEQMRTWGLAKPAPVEESPIKVEVTNPPDAATASPAAAKAV